MTAVAPRTLDDRLICQGIDYYDDETVNCCKNPSLIERNGHSTCVNCGQVHEVVVETSNYERRVYTKEEADKRRHSSATTNDIGFRTTITGFTDAKGKTIPPRNIELIRRIKKWNKFITDNLERNLSSAFFYKSLIERRLNIPKPDCEDAWKDYINCVKKKLVGPSIPYTIAACYFANTRRIPSPPTFTDLAEAIIDSDSTSMILESEKKLWDAVKRLSKKGVFKYYRPTINDYIQTITTKLKFSEPLRVKIINFCNNYFSDLKVNNAVIGACAVIYLACELDEKITQKAIAESTGVSEVSIRSYIKRIGNKVTISGYYIPKIVEKLNANEINLSGGEVTNFYLSKIRPLLTNLDSSEKKKLYELGSKSIAAAVTALAFNDELICNLVKKFCFSTKTSTFAETIRLIQKHTHGQTEE